MGKKNYCARKVPEIFFGYFFFKVVVSFLLDSRLPPPPPRGTDWFPKKLSAGFWKTGSDPHWGLGNKLHGLIPLQGSPYCRKVREACCVLDLDVQFFPCPQRGPTYRTGRLGVSLGDPP